MKLEMKMKLNKYKKCLIKLWYKLVCPLAILEEKIRDNYRLRYQRKIDCITEEEFVNRIVKNIENNDDRYESMYEIRYNVSLTIGKPSIYSDVIAKVVVDKNGKIFIESINDFEF